MNKSKRIFSILAAATLACSTLALSACGNQEYQGEALTDGYVSDASVSSNGGFLVEKGNYVYFINGQETNTADNTYGEVVKGALLRLSKSELVKGNYDKAQIVVPSLFVTGSYDSGIYIYGDYVYYATPTTDKDKDGNIANSSLDFKRAKIDGTEAPMGGKEDYFFRLTSNTTKYRYVQEGDVVYCLYEENGTLKSYNVDTKETVVLVSGAESYFYDTQDLASPNVYYTMKVSKDLDKANATDESYNQIYCVNAANTVEVDADEASYQAKNADGDVIAEYDFDEDFLQAQADEKEEEAKEQDTEVENPYDAADHATYPYVNLGELVLDGIGSTQSFPEYRKHDDDNDVSKASQPFGYTYTLQSQTNGGLYFTRKAAKAATANDPTYLYYIGNERKDWNTITSNQSVELVATNTTAASATAVYTKLGDEHTYLYVEGTVLKRGTVNGSVSLAHGVSGITLWKTEGNYLYYYGTGTNGKSLSRIDYTGTQADYNFLGDEKYDAVTLPLVDFSDSWYKPEFVTVGEEDEAESFVFYPNAQSFGAGATAYNNIYVAKLGTNEEINARQDAVDEVNDYIDEYSSNTQIQAAMRYYFRTGETKAYDEVIDLYTDKQQEYFADFTEKFTDDEGEFKNSYESDFIALVGRLNEKEEEEIATAWADSLLKETSEDSDEEGLPTWAIVLIVCGSVLVVAAAVVIPTVIVMKKKRAQKRKEEAIVSAYKHKKLDTTDDKSIDVYADDETTEEVAEEAPVEEVAEGETEAPAEE